MSLHIAVFAPATRVMSRKLGPTWRSASPCSVRRAAAWEASTFASTCGRWLKTATSRSCVSASTVTGRAPTSSTKRWSRSYSSPPDCSCGVRYQTAPWKRSARACSTPALSAPAIGWPPTKRGSAVRLTRSCLVEPTSETTVSGPDASSAARTSCGSTPTGAHAKQRSAPPTASSTEFAARSIAPRSAATRSRSGSRPKPTISAPWTCSPAARPIEPPISPTPRTAIRTPSPAIRQAPGRARCAGASYSRKLLARQLGRRLELAQVRREVVRVERLRAVADGLLRGRVDLHNDPVGAGGGGRERQRLHQRALPGRVARVDHDRQVREPAQNRDRHQVEREAVARLVGSDAALAEHHLLVALLQHVLTRHEELLERRGQPALQQHRLARAAHLGEQRVVLHVARAELDDVGHLEHRLEVAHVHQLGHDRQAGLGLRLSEQPQPGLAEALEGVGRRARLVGAAAQELRARVPHGARRVEQHLARLDRARTGDGREVIAADATAVDLEDGSLLTPVLERRELVRLEDRHQVVDARRAIETEVRDVLAIADRADDGYELARGDVSVRADGLHALHDGVDLRLRRPLFHDDHHLSLKPLKVDLPALRCVGAASGDAVRLAKSVGAAVRGGPASHSDVCSRLRSAGPAQPGNGRSRIATHRSPASSLPGPARRRRARSRPASPGGPRPRPRRARPARPTRSSPGCRWSRSRAPRARTPRASARSPSAPRAARPRPR